MKVKMKKMIGVVCAVAIGTSILAGCSLLGNANGYKEGTRTETGYVSEQMGLKFDLPDGMVMLNDEEMKQAVPSNAALTNEMMAVSTTNGDNVILLAEQVANNVTEEKYLEDSKQQLKMGSSSDIDFEDSSTVTLAGLEFTELSYTRAAPVAAEGSADPGEEQKQTQLFRKEGDRMIVMTLTYSDDAGLGAMLAGFSSLASEN